MIEFVYRTAAALGYTHPLHPAVTHIPMGMIIGGFIFKVASLKWQELAKTAYYCFILALIFAPFTALLGYMDWQHRLFGKMNGYIVAKFVLTSCLIALLSMTVYLNHKGKVSDRILLVFYTLCLLTAGGLGFVGGELAYG
jgi:uncharacterized membrane protein